MDRIKLWGDESNTYVLIALFTAFLLLAYNPTLAMVYFVLCIISYILYADGNFRSFPFIKDKGNWVLGILYGGIHYIIFIYGCSFIMGRLGYSQFSSAMSVVKLIASTNPILAGSSILTLMAFGLLIPRVETVLWARLMEWFASMFHITLSRISIGLVLLLIGLGGLAVAFHLQAKGIVNNPAQIAVFIFFVYSLVLILIYRETIQAVVMHTIANSLAIYTTMAIGAALSVPVFGLNPMLIFAIIGIYFAWKYKLLNKVGVGA